MSEHLQDIYESLPTEVLLKENVQIGQDIANLMHKREIIIEVLRERYDPEH